MAGMCEGRVCIITGAGRGIGREYALMLAEQGAKVVVNDLGGSRDGTGAGTNMADQVVDEIKAAGGEAVPDYNGVDSYEGGEAIVPEEEKRRYHGWKDFRIWWLLFVSIILGIYAFFLWFRFQHPVKMLPW